MEQRRVSSDDEPHHRVEIYGELLVCDLLADAVSNLARQNLHQSFTRKLSHQVVLKQAALFSEISMAEHSYKKFLGVDNKICFVFPNYLRG